MSRKSLLDKLKRLKVPKVLMVGLLMASFLGWNGIKNVDKLKNYYEIKQIFPVNTFATEVLDGDTFVAKNGLSVRLLGINAPDRGEPNNVEATNYLTHLILNKPLSFEYDKYQDDKFGRILVYVWIDCIDEISVYCHEDRALVNEVLVKKGFAVGVVYDDRKKLKYQDLLNP